jgi:2-polyprenyl-3-methyl-5-hydroxy-6-metoxy-1,4-benzoquinol methylase
MIRRSVPAARFERLYRDQPDPWNLGASPYEAAKYAATVTALPDRRFASGLEVGCSIGTLSAHLAPRCINFLGVDFAQAPLAEARRRCEGHPGALFRHMAVPEEWPEGSFDLIVLSEVLYYLDLTDLDALAARCESSLRPGGVILLVNWRGPNDGTMSGDSAALSFLAALPEGWPANNVSLLPRYRIDHAMRR